MEREPIILSAGVFRSARCRRLGIAGALLWCCSASPAIADSVKVITSPEHAQQALDRGFIQAAFTMRLRRWPDGSPVRVFVLPDTDPAHAEFSREELGTYPYVLRGIWDRLVFTGTGFAPTVVSTEEEMSRRVRSTPGAIGYVRIANAKEAPVRVVPVPSEKNQ